MMVSLVGHFLGKGGQYPQQGLGTYWQQYVPGRSYHTSSFHNPSSGVHYIRTSASIKCDISLAATHSFLKPDRFPVAACNV